MADWAQQREKKEGRCKNERSLTSGKIEEGRGWMHAETPSDAVRHCSGSTTYSKDRQAFAKRCILRRLTPSRSYNVDEDPNLCGYHMNGQGKMVPNFRYQRL